MGFLQKAKQTLKNVASGAEQFISNVASGTEQVISKVLEDSVVGEVADFAVKANDFVQTKKAADKQFRQDLKDNTPEIQARRDKSRGVEQQRIEEHKERFKTNLPKLLEFTAAPGVTRLGVGFGLQIGHELGLTGESIEIPDNLFLRSFLGTEPIVSPKKKFGDIGSKFALKVKKGEEDPLIAGAKLALIPIFAGIEIIPGVGGNAKKIPLEVASGLIQRHGDEALDVINVMRKKGDLSIFDKKLVKSVEQQLVTSNISINDVDTLRAIEQSVQTKYAGSINKFRLGTSATANKKIDKAITKLKPELEKIVGSPLTDDEIIAASHQAEVLKKVVTRDETKEWAASITKLRQNIADEAYGKGISKEFLENMKVQTSQATDIGRKLRSFAIRADDVGGSIKEDLIKRFIDNQEKLDDIVKRAEKIDFNNTNEATKFYREFVKPNIVDILDEMRYLNLLSSPKTHSTNAFSNMIQAVVTAPAVRLVEGSIDLVGSKLTGKAQEAFISEVPEYFKGFINSIPNATTDALDALRGRAFIERPDLPTPSRIGTGSKITKPFQIVTRALEAGDIFFRTIITQAERAALGQRAVKAGKKIDPKKLDAEASKRAEYFIFRQKLHPEDQGILLNKLDDVTELIQSAVHKIPGMGWLVPFVRTPTNILKQGIEFSPAGWATLLGAGNKREQAAKALVGSFVTASTGYIMMTHESTWAYPDTQKERDVWKDNNIQPYSIKFGNKWYSYSKLGPLAYPIALAGALKYEFTEDPERFDQKTLGKIGDVLGGMASFFADQSYVQNLSLLSDALKDNWQGDSAKRRLEANFGRQIVPLSALLGWTTRIIDPIVRESDSAAQDIIRGIPFFSEGLEARIKKDGEVVKRSNTFLNSFVPGTIFETNDAFSKELSDSKGAREKWEEIKALDVAGKNEELQRLWDDDRTLYTSVVKEKLWDELGITKEDRELAPLGVENKERSREIFKIIEGLGSKEEKNAYILKLWDAGIISSEVNEQLTELLSNNQVKEK